MRSWLTRHLSEFVDRYRDAAEPRPMPSSDPDEWCQPGEATECEAERLGAQARSRGHVHGTLPLVEDIEFQAAQARYKSGKLKRTRYKLVDLSKRYVVIVLHQMGVERASSSSRWWRVTAHRAIKPDATRVKIHPVNVRLVAANRLDRDPFHAVNIEVGGNFEALDGSGRWWAPEVMGRGRASSLQLEATRQAVIDVRAEVQWCGGIVRAIVPHILSSVDPFKPACCGSRVWSLVGEWAGAELGLAVPDGATFGGLNIPREWHGPYWARCTERLRKGFWPT